MELRGSAFHVLQLVLTCCLLGGCQSPGGQQGMLEQKASGSRLSSHQLRVMVNEFVVHYADRVEFAADQILADTTDPAIRKNALLWKIKGISACFQAASRSDPLAAYLDVWILNRQMVEFFNSPTGSTLFGPAQDIALNESRSLERRLGSIDQAVGDHSNSRKEFVNKFAADFPLMSLYFDREPIASRYIEEVREPASELMQVVANLDHSVDELKQLSILFAKHLPKQSRWEAELFLIDATQVAVVQHSLQDLASATESMSRIANVAEGFPNLVQRERDVLHDLVIGERQQTLRELDRMREDTLNQFKDERSTVIDALREERIAVLQAIGDERVAMSEDLQSEVSKALQSTDAITRQRAEEIVEQAPGLIDHFFWRLWQITVAIAFAVVLAVLAWLIVRAKRETGPAAIRIATPESPAESTSLHEDELRRAA